MPLKRGEWQPLSPSLISELKEAATAWGGWQPPHRLKDIHPAASALRAKQQRGRTRRALGRRVSSRQLSGFRRPWPRRYRVQQEAQGVSHRRPAAPTFGPLWAMGLCALLPLPMQGGSAALLAVRQRANRGIQEQHPRTAVTTSPPALSCHEVSPRSAPPRVAASICILGEAWLASPSYDQRPNTLAMPVTLRWEDRRRAQRR